MKMTKELMINIFLTVPLIEVIKGKIGETEEPLANIIIIEILPITFKTPAIIGMDDLLASETPITVRYSHLGDIYKFDTKIIGANEKPFKVTYLSYPHVVEKIEYRNTQRVSCFIPASLIYSDTEISGMITDISLGGCKFRTDSIDQVEGILIKKEGKVVLNFPLLGLEGIRKFEGIIKKVEFDNDFALGIGFSKIDKKTNKILSSFIEDALEFRSF